MPTGQNTAGGSAANSPRIRSLIENHMDLARLACTGETQVFWVLDLEDEKAVRFAEGFKPREEILALRDKEAALGNIAALTIGSPLEVLNWYRTNIQQRPTMPPPMEGHIYMVICSEERFAIATLPTMQKQMEASL